MKLFEVFQDKYINHYKTKNGLSILINKDERDFLNKFKNTDVIAESDLDDWYSNLAFRMSSKGLLKEIEQGYKKG